MGRETSPLCNPQEILVGGELMQKSRGTSPLSCQSGAVRTETRSPRFTPWFLPANDVTSLGLGFHIRKHKKTEEDTACGNTAQVKWRPCLRLTDGSSWTATGHGRDSQLVGDPEHRCALAAGGRATLSQVSQISSLIPNHTTNFLKLTPSTLVLENLPWLPCALQNKSCTLNLPFRAGTRVRQVKQRGPNI